MTLPREIPRYRLTEDDYHRMAEAGILGEDDRVELIQGELIEMTPIGSGHAGTVSWIAQRFSEVVAGRAVVWTQNPLRLDRHSEPQPDVALLRPRLDAYRASLPTPDDVLLVVEVADSSLAYHRDIKGPLYGAHAIPEYWLVDLAARCLVRYRQPSADGYARSDHQDSGAVALEALPRARLDLTELLG